MKWRIFAILFLLSGLLVSDIYISSAFSKEPAEKCAECHSDSIVFKEWQNSNHANSIKTLLADSNASRSCLKCHSADFNRFRFNPWMSLGDLPAPKDAGNPVSCSSCHKHESDIESGLIMPADKLCKSCHVLYCGG